MSEHANALGQQVDLISSAYSWMMMTRFDSIQFMQRFEVLSANVLSDSV